MKARLDRHELLTALTAVKPAVSTTRPFIQLSVTDGGMEVRADDLNVGITARISAWCGSDEGDCEGTVVVPFRKVADFVTLAEDTHVEVVQTDNVVELGGGKGVRMKVTVADNVVEFPRRSEPDKKGGVTARLDGAKWAAVQALVPFASTDPAMGIRTGVQFYPECAVATDSFILGRVDADFGFEVAVPAGVIAAIGKDADLVTLAADDRSLRLESGGVIVVTSVLQGDFGDVWRHVIDKNPPTSFITTTADSLRKAVAVAKIPARTGIGGGKDMLIRIAKTNATARRVTLESWPDESTPEDVASCVLEAECEGEVFDLSFQERWLDAPLRLVGTDEDGLVKLELTAPRAPMYVRRGDAFALMMPLRPPA